MSMDGEPNNLNSLKSYFKNIVETYYRNVLLEIFYIFKKALKSLAIDKYYH